MPDTLKVPETNGGRMFVAPPRLNLRRAKSYNAQDRGPVSATSSTFNFNHLLFSPPASPSLPSLVPKPKRRSSDLLKKARPSRLLRRALGLILSVSGLVLLLFTFRNRDSIPAVWPYFSEQEYEMVGQDAFPDFPTPIVIQDAQGRTKWTVSIPPSHPFPLTTDEYAEMGNQCREVAARAQDLHRSALLSEKVLTTYDATDANFVDVDEAERTGLLLHPPLESKPGKDVGHFIGADAASLAGKPVCESSMTFVLESTDAGIGNSLMMLWTFYGLAKSQGRSFFIDDSRWAYGEYTQLFKAPPSPTCRPPPRHQMVPCPFQARHLLVSAMTAKDTFPSLFAQHHRTAGTKDQLYDLWQLARTGYENLFNLNQEDQQYVDERVRTLRTRSKSGVTAPNAPLIGVHVRRGDRHPLEAQYSQTYIPSYVFKDSAKELARNHSAYSDNAESRWRHNEPIMILASDDPMVHNEREFASALSAQDHIELISRDPAQQEPKSHAFIHRFHDEQFGWEGGFFPAMFWNLGIIRKNNAANAPEGVEVKGANMKAKFSAPPTPKTLRLRNLVGRAYMLDLAVLSRASDGVVCAVSAMGCRLLGVMMDWDKGVGGHAWVNVDGDFGWTGIEW